MITLREVARELTRIATDVRDVAGRVDGPDSAHFAAARDLRAIAADLDHRAERAERIGHALLEPDPDDLSWIADAAPGEITEVYGR